MYIPPLLATYLLLDDAWRRILLAFYAAAAATYVVEYAFVLLASGLRGLRRLRSPAVPMRSPPAAE